MSDVSDIRTGDGRRRLAAASPLRLGLRLHVYTEGGFVRGETYVKRPGSDLYCLVHHARVGHREGVPPDLVGLAELMGLYAASEHAAGWPGVTF